MIGETEMAPIMETNGALAILTGLRIRTML